MKPHGNTGKRNAAKLEPMQSHISLFANSSDVTRWRALAVAQGASLSE